MHGRTRQQALEIKVAGRKLRLDKPWVILGLRRDRHAQPQVGKDDVTAVHQVIHRRSAHFVRVFHRRRADLQGQLAPLLVQLIELRHMGLELRMLGIGRAELMHNFGKPTQQLALAAQYLAPEQVQSLDAVGAFIDRGDTCVTGQLLHAPLTNIAMATEYLHAVVGHLQAGFGHEGFADRREEGQQVLGFLALAGVAAQVRGIEQLRGEIGQGAVAFVEGFHGQQHATDIGVHDDRVGGFLRGLGTGQRAHLQTVVGVLDRALEARLAVAQALHAGAQARVVHHGEHAVEALVRLANQKALGAIEVQHAGGRGLDAHLVFDGAAVHRIALAGVGMELGHDKQ